MTELETAKILAAAVKLAEKYTKEELNKLRTTLAEQIDSVQTIIGPKGERGDNGASGPKGDRGERGMIGPVGLKGDTGDKGDRGDVGKDGAEGIQGIEGPQGIQGVPGERGAVGSKGDKGDTGARGDKGDEGKQGKVGPKGDTGALGPKGGKGDRGDTGNDGRDGKDGETGSQGEQGQDGRDGVDGKDGMLGPKGNAGPRGPQGDKGDIGPQGDKGDPGKDAEVKPIIEKIETLEKDINTRITRMAYNVASGEHSAGSGEVLLRGLDDVNYNAVQTASDGQGLIYNQSTGKWEAGTGLAGKTGIVFVIDGGGAEITTGQKGHLVVPFDCTIDKWTILGDQTGSIIVDIWKTPYSGYPPTIANTITGTDIPTISSTIKNQSTALTGWTTTIDNGDILAYNVVSIYTIQRVSLVLNVTKN